MHCRIETSNNNASDSLNKLKKEEVSTIQQLSMGTSIYMYANGNYAQYLNINTTLELEWILKTLAHQTCLSAYNWVQ